MISDKTLNLEWINSVSRKKRNADRILIEKVIRALLLLEGLAESGSDFIFKGGTALMLLQGSTIRLSIDIDSSFVQQDDAPVTINVASFEDMLGDKLTAFAPYTTGIPYEKNGHSKAMEIIKQLYDIGNLFDDVKNLEIVRETFKQFALKKLSYRNLEQNQNRVLQDIFETALCISTRGLEGNGNFTAPQNGISQIRVFIFSETYQIEKAIVHAAKAAYLSKLIEFNGNSLERFDNALQVKDWTIEQPFFMRLNRLKKSNPQAFFYWYKTYELLKGILPK